jgi:hypothetical protein
MLLLSQESKLMGLGSVKYITYSFFFYTLSMMWDTITINFFYCLFSSLHGEKNVNKFTKKLKTAYTLRFFKHRECYSST